MITEKKIKTYNTINLLQSLKEIVKKTKP